MMTTTTVMTITRRQAFEERIPPLRRGHSDISLSHITCNLQARLPGITASDKPNGRRACRSNSNRKFRWKFQIRFTTKVSSFLPWPMCNIIIIGSRRQQRSLCQLGMPTTVGLRPFSADAERGTVADLLYPRVARAAWASAPPGVKAGTGSNRHDLA